MTDAELALAHYRITFPTLLSLGAVTDEQPIPPLWKAEYDRLVASGLSATLITGSTFEGGGATAQRNFDQKALLEALLARRAELDPAFDDVAFAPVAIKPRQRLGITVMLGDYQ